MAVVQLPLLSFAQANPFLAGVQSGQDIGQKRLDMIKQAIANKYAPMTSLADALSKYTYSKYMQPQYALKAVENANVIANSKPGQIQNIVQTALAPTANGPVYPSDDAQSAMLNALGDEIMKVTGKKPTPQQTMQVAQQAQAHAQQQQPTQPQPLQQGQPSPAPVDQQRAQVAQALLQRQQQVQQGQQGQAQPAQQMQSVQQNNSPTQQPTLQTDVFKNQAISNAMSTNSPTVLVQPASDNAKQTITQLTGQPADWANDFTAQSLQNAYKLADVDQDSQPKLPEQPLSNDPIENITRLKTKEARATQLGKINADDLQDINKTYNGYLKEDDSLSGLSGDLKDIQFQAARQFPGYQSLQMNALSKIGDLKIQKRIGDFMTNTNDLQASMAKDLGRAAGPELAFVNQAKINPNDTIGVMIGKYQALQQLNKLRLNRALITSSLMRRNPELDSGRAAYIADRVIPKNKLMDNIIDSFSGPVQVRNNKTGKIITVPNSLALRLENGEIKEIPIQYVKNMR